jgi:hypothetical protein
MRSDDLGSALLGGDRLSQCGVGATGSASAGGSANAARCGTLAMLVARAADYRQMHMRKQGQLKQ